MHIASLAPGLVVFNPKDRAAAADLTWGRRFFRGEAGRVATGHARVQVVSPARIEKSCASANGTNFEDFSKLLRRVPPENRSAPRAPLSSVPPICATPMRSPGRALKAGGTVPAASRRGRDRAQEAAENPLRRAMVIRQASMRRPVPAGRFCKAVALSVNTHALTMVLPRCAARVPPISGAGSRTPVQETV